jgi:hypothetical protein
MPRPKLARRFEPRFGVSQSMLDAESRYVAKELEDYLLLSINDLRESLKERQSVLGREEGILQDMLRLLPDHQRLALRCMLARDVSHIAALYQVFLRGLPEDEKVGRSTPLPEELTPQEESRPVLAFGEWLFQP